MKCILISRWLDFVEQTGRSNNFRGNGYVVISTDGVLTLIPEWKSLENTLGRLTPATMFVIVVSDIVSTKDNETYIRTSVMKGGEIAI